MDSLIGDDLVGGRPSVGRVLGIRQRHEVEFAPELVSHHDIVCRDARFAAKVVFVEVIVDADQFGIGTFQAATSELVACDTIERIVETFVLANPAARHEPETLRGTIDTVTEQIRTVAVRYDQVDRNERGCVDDAQESVQRKHGGWAPGNLSKCMGIVSRSRRAGHGNDVPASSMSERWMPVCMHRIMAGRDCARRPKHRSNPPIPGS